MPLIRKEDVRDWDFTFTTYRKVGVTKISDQTLSVGTEVETLEGKYVCSEVSRLAIDAMGNIYPIAESVFKKSYEKSNG